MLIKILNHVAKLVLAQVRSYQLKRLTDRGLTIGTNVNIQPGVILDPSHCWHITIGNNVTLAPDVHILAHDASTKFLTGLTRIGKVEIQDGVFIGAKSSVLPGVTIGQNSIIGAGSVVTKSIPAGMVASGNPAQVLCKIETFKEKHLVAQSHLPCFNESYTIENGITPAMKQKMNHLLAAAQIGYVP